jgi:ribosomal protein L29
MTLLEMSKDYEAAAVPLRNRLRELRHMLKQTEDPEEIWHIKRRIAQLTPMLTEMNELAELTARYYERGYYRSDKYTL